MQQHIAVGKREINRSCHGKKRRVCLTGPIRFQCVSVFQMQNSRNLSERALAVGYFHIARLRYVSSLIAA